MTRNLGLAIVLGFMALGISACGGSSGTTVPAPQNPPHGVGTVAVEIVTVSGSPVSGVEVHVSGGDHYQGKTTNANGRVQFTRVPAGNVSIDAGGWGGYHWAWREIVVNRNSTTDLTIAVVPSNEATPVVIATDAQPADDGRTLTVDVDLAILGEDGLAIPTFTAADFWISGSDCGFGMCVMGASGEPLMNGSYGAEVDASVFSWHDAPSTPPAGSATALLLEHSTRTVEYDVDGHRTGAVHAFLDSVIAPDSVAVASYRGTPQSPVVSTYGPFTSDGFLFHGDIDSLAALDAELNPLYPALEELLSWSATQTAVSEPKSIVLVSNWGSWPDDECGNDWACRHEQRVAISDASRTLGIPVVTIGGSDPAADIAARSGGSAVVIQDPTQYAIALGNLKPIVSRQLGFNRVRFVLNSGPQVFASGNTVWASAQVRIAPDSRIIIPVVITIP